MKKLLSIAVCLCFSSQADSYVYPGRPNCPWAVADGSHTWASYLNQEYGDAEPLFSIQFTRDVGDIEAGQCYTVTYLGNQNWSGSGKIRGVSPHTSKREVRNGGDPKANQINVWGARFTFNEAGELFFDGDALLAGNMYCHIGSECWR